MPSRSGSSCFDWLKERCTSARATLRKNFEAKSSPFPQEGGKSAKGYRILNYVLAVMLSWFVFWTLTKIPNLPVSEAAMTNLTYNATYCAETDDRACFGPEMQVNLFVWSDYRALKLITSPSLFISVHAALAIVLEVLLVFVLLRGYEAARPLSIVLFPLSFVFALHILPVEGGFPTRATTSGDSTIHINLMCILVMWIAAGAGAAGRWVLTLPRFADKSWRGSSAKEWGAYLEYVAWIAIGIDLNTAPVGEWTLLAVSNTTVAPEGDEPHPDSGHGPYSACECPALGYVLTWLILLAGLGYTLHITGVLACVAAHPLYVKHVHPLYDGVRRHPRVVSVLGAPAKPLPKAAEGSGTRPSECSVDNTMGSTTTVSVASAASPSLPRTEPPDAPTEDVEESAPCSPTCASASYPSEAMKT